MTGQAHGGRTPIEEPLALAEETKSAAGTRRPFRLLVLAANGVLADEVRAALDVVGVGVDIVPGVAPWWTIVRRALRADAVLDLTSLHDTSESAGGILARFLGRAKRASPTTRAVLSLATEGPAKPEEERSRLEQLGTDLVRGLGGRTTASPHFLSLACSLRKRQDEIWTAMTWPPPDPAIRREADEELETLQKFLVPHAGWSLDLGSGAGRGARVLAQRSRAVAAMDLSMEMLRRLRANVSLEGSAVIYPVLGDAEHLPFRAGVFGSITAIQVWAHLQFPERLVAEMARVTAPGASLALSTGNAHSLIECYDRLVLFLHELRKGRPGRALQCLRGVRAYWLALRGFARSTTSNVIDELERSHFDVTNRASVGALRTPRGSLPEVLSRWPGVRRFGHLLLVGARRRAVPSRTVVSWKDLCFGALSSFVSREGQLIYGLGEAGASSTEPPRYSTPHRYRLITLIGCEAYRQGVGPEEALDDLIEGLARGLEPWSLDDLGLFLWWKGLRGETDVEGTLAQISRAGLVALSGQDSQTLAFLLLGLTCTVRPQSAAAGFALDVAALLRGRQHSSGLFYAQARRDAAATFNYQAYAALALATSALAYEQPHDLAAARACAERLCRLQGPLGQWWWTYDVARGTVADRYPVFAVHQLGMAPLALFRVGHACGEDFSPWVQRGARWVVGPNEAKHSLVVPERATVWRSVRRRGAGRPLLARTLQWLAWHRVSSVVSLLPAGEVNLEHRPYEYGWLLAALAEAAGDESWLP